MSEFSLTVCVCTRNRPDDLRACLASIAASSVPVAQIVVSDDGDRDGHAAAVCGEFGAEYLTGPRRGLCANRNHALARVRGSHVIFLDDDAELAPDFVALVCARIAAETDDEMRRRLIVSGLERHPDGHVTDAREQSFLGFQEIVYENGAARRTVVINATVFPAALFTEMTFDERIVYGYDEVDLTTRAVAAGWRVVTLPDAINRHNHSPRAREGYAEGRDAARLYVTLRRYARTDERPLRAAAFLVVAPAHLIAAELRRGGLRGALRSLRALGLSLSLLADWFHSGDTRPVLNALPAG